MEHCDILTLQNNDQRVVRLHMKDGEIITAKVLFVSESENDVIVDLISSTAMDHYEKTDVQPAFQFEFRDIAWVEPVSDQQQTV